MERVSFNQVSSLPDALDASGFNLILGNIPLVGSSRQLSLACTSATISGIGNERFTVNVHGHTMQFRGRKTYPGTLAVTYYEVSNFQTHNALRQWHEFITGTNSNNSGGYKNEYSITAALEVYDTTGTISETHTLEALFPQDISDSTLSGESSASMPVSVTFSYDRMIPSKVPVL